MNGIPTDMNRRGLLFGATATTVLLLARLGMAESAEQSRRSSEALQAFSYGDVTLTGGPLGAQAQAVREFFLAIPDDKLLNGFRKRAGLPAPGKPMGGWYDPEDSAGGHSFGQLVSALARTYATTGDARFKDKVARLVHGFHESFAPDGFFTPPKKRSSDGDAIPTTRIASECATPTRSPATRKPSSCSRR